MATTRSTEVQYPSGDGKPLAETPTHRDTYVPIEPVEGRWPSAVTGLHFQRVGHDIRLI